jgi:hypothetical protein
MQHVGVDVLGVEKENRCMFSADVHQLAAIPAAGRGRLITGVRNKLYETQLHLPARPSMNDTATEPGYLIHRGD